MIGPILHGIIRLSSLFLQVSASLEEQAFTEAWGQKAKATFPESLLETFTNPDLKKIITKIKVLGPANLPTAERERVNWHIPLKLWRKELLVTHPDCVLITLFVFSVQYHSEPDGQHLLNCKGVSHSRGMLVFGAWWETLPTLCWCVSVRVKANVKITYTQKHIQVLVTQRKNDVLYKLEAWCVREETKKTNHNLVCKSGIVNINIVNMLDKGQFCSSNYN